MPQPWRTGIITRIEQETESTRRFWIQVTELESFDFIPGQFVTLDLPIHEKPNKRWRSYSIASWPDGTNTFELVIVLLEGGLGTHYLFNETTVGSSLTLRGPQGVFVLPQVIDRDVFLICTGTGVAPFRSMAHHIINHQVEHQHIYLIFGCRKTSDCLYGKELKELEAILPSFHYIPTYSREEPGDHYKTGYVHAVYEEICKHETIETNGNGAGSLKPAYFYLCGWKNMIDEAKERIVAMGYDRKTIHQELYG
jgi:CDP-4-dehydro-6-deoxyglucose reductase